MGLLRFILKSCTSKEGNDSVGNNLHLKISLKTVAIPLPRPDLGALKKLQCGGQSSPNGERSPMFNHVSVKNKKSNLRYMKLLFRIKVFCVMDWALNRANLTGGASSEGCVVGFKDTNLQW